MMIPTPTSALAQADVVALLSALERWLAPDAGWATGVLALYYGVLGVLAFYGLHRLRLVWLFGRTGVGALDEAGTLPAPPALPDDAWPVVTVQLPVFNERYVVERLIDTTCALDYPRDRLEIQVLDDSTDATREIAAARVAHWRAQGFDIHHVHRTDRSGFKAGALEAGQRAARGALLAIFDADFLPNPDFLRHTVPHFQDAEIGMVQARWAHINREVSLLTRIQAILLDGHFVIEHTARHRSGCFFNFNGTAGVWRRRTIDDAGGWQHDTLTEDLDLSFRAQLRGWRFVYLPELAVPAELPVEIRAFKTQQQRWSKGSIQTGRKLLHRILGARLPLHTKFEAFVNLTNNLSYPLMIALSLLVFPAMALRRDSDVFTTLLLDVPLFLAATASVLAFYIASQRALGNGWQRRLWQLPLLMGLGIGLAVSNSRAVLTGLWQRGGVFHRTPKLRIEKRADARRMRRHAYRLGFDVSFVIEVALMAYLAICVTVAIAWGMWFSLPFLLLFLHGYGYMVMLELVPRLRRAPAALAPAVAAGALDEAPSNDA
ncbi:MAG: glycosyltransferase [Acidobacteriota bacterium]